jgi:hypothetical protein
VRLHARCDLHLTYLELSVKGSNHVDVTVPPSMHTIPPGVVHPRVICGAWRRSVNVAASAYLQQTEGIGHAILIRQVHVSFNQSERLVI